MKTFREIMLLTTVLFITQISTVIIAITHQAIIKALACVTVKQILAAIWGKKKTNKPLMGHQSIIGCYSSSWYNITEAYHGRGDHNGDLSTSAVSQGRKTMVWREPPMCSRSYNKLL